MRHLRTFFLRFPMYVLFAFLSFFVWMMIYNEISDTSADKKVTLFINAQEVKSTDLSVYLEEEMPEGIKMVQAKPFLYALVTSDALLNADLYIVRESDFEEFHESFTGMEAFKEAHPSYEYKDFGNGISGIHVYDKEEGPAIGTDFIDYDKIPEEEKETAVPSYYLFFGTNSVHLGADKEGALDDAAWKAAERFLGLGKDNEEDTMDLAEEGLSVKKVDNIPADFIFGMDVSSVIAEENSGVRYFDFAGREEDLFKILSDAGINLIRVRIWNHPFDEEGRGYGGGNCDIETALKIGKRSTENHMKLFADFHLSDFWADPGKQKAPLAWEGLDIEEKSENVYLYVKDCLEQMKEAGIDVGMVQIGNETNGGLCGEKKWENICRLMKAGSRAVREVLPEAQTVLHFSNPENASAMKEYAKQLALYEVDYDVFASSYYPFWHGTLDNLASVLTSISETYGKKTLIAETSYAYTEKDTDFFHNTVGETVQKLSLS